MESSREDHDRLWERYRRLLCEVPHLGFSLDASRSRFDGGFLGRMSGAAAAALDAMAALESGAIANPDEGRRVGHYWLRAPERAPDAEIRAAIEDGVRSVTQLADAVHRGEIHGAGGRFEHAVHIGIGGSALGPQLLCDALPGGPQGLDVHFLDNADPSGIDRLMARLGDGLGRTLVSVVSKSGWTPTPHHVMLEVEAAYRRRGLDFSRHAVATPMAGTALDRRAREQGWLARFPLWDWVGGRTSVTSAVGLLPAALRGIDVGELLRGAAAMDEATRARAAAANPALLLALLWHWLGGGRGNKNMVVLPYRDQLALFARYVQQLVMESVGKERDRTGAVVHQGLTVYGHKGSTDQHAYVQQLKDGRADFLVTFIAFGDPPREAEIEVEPGATLSDYLFGYLEGTRKALHERGRDSITLRFPALSPSSLGALIALYERAVGLYAELIDVNAYHQPGVDKDAAAGFIAVQQAAIGHLSRAGVPQTAEEIAAAIGRADDVETVYKAVERLARIGGRGVAGAAETPPRLAERFVATSPADLSEGPEAEAAAAPPSEIEIPLALHERLVATVAARFPRKTFGYFVAGPDDRAPTDFVIYEDNLRNEPGWRPDFVSRGRYFVEHDDAGFVASPAEVWRIQRELWARGLERVGVFHSHQRHPANF